jgi:hypothetical protein
MKHVLSLLFLALLSTPAWGTKVINKLELTMKQVFRLFLAAVFVAALSWAALPTKVVWEVRTTGADTNGGGYLSTGTDMSQYDNKNAASCTSCQSATINISTTDAVAAGTTTIVSATGNFSSALVGNVIYLAGGTGTLTGDWYYVSVVTNSTTITVDRTVATGTGITMNIGGALLTISQGLALMTQSSDVWVKTGTGYSISVGLTIPGGVNDDSSKAPNLLLGYTSTRGDNGRPVISTTSAITMLTIAMYNVVVANFTLNAGQTATTGVSTSVNGKRGTRIFNILCQNGFVTYGIYTANGGSVYNSRVTAMKSGATAGVYYGGPVFNTIVDGSLGTVPGFKPIYSDPAEICVGCIAYNNGGAGFDMTDGNGGLTTYTLESCVAYGNGSDGIKNTNAYYNLIVRNCALIKNTGYGINNGVVEPSFALPFLDYNAYGSGAMANTLGALHYVPQGAHDVTGVSADPFVAAASLNFALNTSNPGGAQLAALGFPGQLIAGGTGYRDIGAVQHACPGESSSAGYPGTLLAGGAGFLSIGALQPQCLAAIGVFMTPIIM